MCDPGGVSSDAAAPPATAEAVRTARERRGWSQEELAERAGLSPRSISDIERGVSRKPRPRTIAAIAAALDLAASDLAGQSLSEPPGAPAPAASSSTRPVGFGRRLRALRVERGLTQGELARAALMSERAISDLERGRNRSPRRESAALLADALELASRDREAFLALASEARDGARDSALSHAPRVPLVGRVDELRTLVDAVRAERLVSVLGPGGVGKTRLALAAIEELRDLSCLFVPAADAYTFDDLVTALAAALGVREGGDRALIDLVIDGVRHVDVLVVDNLEQVVGPAAELVSLLVERSAVRIVATSRIRLRVSGEYPLALAPLGFARGVGVTTASTAPGGTSARPTNPAVDLFVANAELERPGWQPSGADSDTIEHICARLDGLPLAVELAAAWMRLLGPQEILDRLDRPLALLADGRRDLPERQRSLAAVIDGTYGLLGEHARKLFARIAVLPSPFGVALVEQVARDLDVDVLRALAELVDTSLVRAHPNAGDGESRFEWLATIRDYGLERLDNDGGRDAAERAMIAAISDIATTASPHLVGPGQAAWIARLERERPHLRAAVEVCLRRDDSANAMRLGAALWRYWYVAGHYSEGVDLLGRIVAMRGAAAPGDHATVRYGLATLHYLRGDVATAEVRFHEALEAYRALGDGHGVSSSLSNLGMIDQYRGEYQRAAARFAEALDVATAFPSMRARAVALANLASLANHTGDLGVAHERYSESLAVFRSLGDDRGRADVSLNLAEIAATRGDLDNGVIAANEALTAFVSLGDRSGTSDANGLLGRIAIEAGDAPTAIRRLLEAQRLARELGDSWGEAAAGVSLALVADDPVRARIDVEGWLEVQRSLAHHQGCIESLLVIAELALRSGDTDQARRATREAAVALLAADRPHRARVAIAGAAARLGDADLRAGAAAAAALELGAGRAVGIVARSQLARLGFDVADVGASGHPESLVDVAIERLATELG